MSEELANALDLSLAWKRAKADAADRLFVQHPYDFALADLDLGAWLEELRGTLAQGTYRPAPMIVCDIPKAGGGIRPGAILRLTDRVVYAACVGAAQREVVAAMQGGALAADYGVRLRGNPTEPAWVKTRFEGWKLFREKTKAGLSQGFPYLLFADLSGYYENIELGVLVSDLRQAGVSEPVVTLLSMCLNKWAVVPGRGLPQGHTASDILAKLYLNSVDLNLGAMGLQHIRYVDDYRVFCADRLGAKKAMVVLIQLLRRRGLSLHSGKSQVFSAAAAKTEVEGILPALDAIRLRFLRELAQFFDMEASGLTIADADGLLSENIEEAPIDVITQAFTEYFASPEGEPREFDKTLFHFLLGRLGKAQNRFALDHCLGILLDHPEETEAVLRYVSACGAEIDCEVRIGTIAESPESRLYPYQQYQILAWRNGWPGPLDQQILATARQHAFDGGPPYLKAVARETLARFGTPADLERMEGEYPLAQGPDEQADLVCSVRRMEVGRRNAFLARAAGDGPQVARAVRLVRAGGLAS